jgi:hypothetical protein
MLTDFKLRNYVRNLVCEACLREGYVNIQREHYESFKNAIAKYLDMSQFNFTLLKYDAHYAVVGVTLNEEVFQDLRTQWEMPAYGNC